MNAYAVPPRDPWDIQLSYQHGQRWWFDDDTEPNEWRISADIYDDGGTHLESHIGDFVVTVIDLDATHNPFMLLDGEDATLGLIAEAIFDHSGRALRPELANHIEPFGSRLLILNSAQLTSPWRGFGLGVLLAGTAIKKLSAGARIAACYPAPLSDTPEQDPIDHALAIATLQEVWEQL